MKIRRIFPSPRVSFSLSLSRIFLFFFFPTWYQCLKFHQWRNLLLRLLSQLLLLLLVALFWSPSIKSLLLNLIIIIFWFGENRSSLRFVATISNILLLELMIHHWSTCLQKIELVESSIKILLIGNSKISYWCCGFFLPCLLVFSLDVWAVTLPFRSSVH